MSMKDGIRALAHGAMDVQDQFARELIAGGMPYEHALTAANAMAKNGFDSRLDTAMENASASAITRNLANIGSQQVQ